MVNEGKITAEEGVRLITAVKYAYNPTHERAKHMKTKMKKAMQDAEPKVKKAAETIWDKSVVVAGEISKGVKNVADDIGERINNSKDRPRTNAYYDNFNFDEDIDDDDNWYEDEE
jgi:S-methylmethionine-dependent homocysteine/selenocysteine methylase